ncbi:hypothetical protein GH714_041018 [Hevea brasiliensis]|uniref:Sulfotransferase n=1 Tax=Hevea brasiliensis TaxID=3981 RepID=A0A6A6N9C4_HEVBR|nr:hypothetical protein GH714_041018 [Hevea brasiliensis]
MDIVYGKMLNVVPMTVVSLQSSKNIKVTSSMSISQWSSAPLVPRIVQPRQARVYNALPLVHEARKGGEKDTPLTQQRVQKIMSNFPRRDDWVLQPLYQYQGFWYFQDYLVGLLAAQENFKPQPSDIVLCTYPKTGTTWLKALAYAIVTRSKFNDSKNPLLTKAPHDCVPFLEIDAARNASNRDPEIPLVATHIPYNSLPTSILESGCKLVYLCRDPKDVLISMWHFLRGKLPEGIDKDSYINLNNSFEIFCEDLKKDTVSNVKKLAEFMGYPFTPEEEKRGVVQQIIDLCSFDSLRNMKASKSGVYSPDSPYTIRNTEFFRKGTIGDWKNYFSEEMGARLDKIIEEKLNSSGFSFLSH